MALTMPAESGGSFEKCPEGNHVAVCCEIIDMGTQYSEAYGKHQRKIWLGWEITSELRDDGTPHRIGKSYTLSSNEKSNLRKDLESWRGVKFTDADFGPGGFEIKKVLGVGCMINVVHEEKQGGGVYANIATIARLPKGMDSPKLSESPLFLSLEKDEYDVRVFGALSDKMQERIRTSPEWQDINAGSPTYSRQDEPQGNGDVEDEIPF